MFRIGDRVWTNSEGWGKVINIRDGEAYPVVVNFESDNSIETFTLEGKEYAVDKRELFFDSYEPTPSMLNRPKDKLIKGKAYWVWDVEGDDKVVRVCKEDDCNKFVSFKKNMGDSDVYVGYYNWELV